MPIPNLELTGVTIYENPNFGGRYKMLGIGEHRFFTPDDFNDVVSSIRVPSGFCAVLFEHADDGGGYGISVDLLEDCADLSKYNFNDKTSYINIFYTNRDTLVYVRNSLQNGQFVAGHWERQRASGPPPPNPVAVVSPPYPPHPPTQPSPQRIAGAQPKQILEIRFQNPEFNDTGDWGTRIAGGKYPVHQGFEWKPILDSNQEYDDVNLVGATGWAISPSISDIDNPFSHPFGFDWEFSFLLDSQFTFLLATGNRMNLKTQTRTPKEGRRLLG